MIVRAHYEFRTTDCEPGCARSSSIQYIADSRETAVTDFICWWDNRNQAVPEYFMTLCAVNFTEILAQRMQPNGFLPTDHGIPFKEWKQDFPWPLSDTHSGWGRF